MSEQSEDVVITSGQVAQLLSVSAATVRRWVQEGRLQPQNKTIGGHLRFRISYIRRFLRTAASDTPTASLAEDSPGHWWTGGDTPKQSGQGLIEFALVLPVLLLIILGFIGFADLFRQVTAMNNAADSGAFYASLGHNAADVEQYVDQRLSEQLVDTDTVDVSIAPSAYSYGDPVTVAITKSVRINAMIWETEFELPVQSTQIVQKEVAGGP